MAHPDLEDGWFKLAYELLPALLLGGFRQEASLVLCEVLAQTFGRGKRPSARLEPARIADRSGLCRQNVWRGVRELVAAGVLAKQADGTYRFAKDYAAWKAGDGPLIRPSLQQYAAVYPIIARSFEAKGSGPDGGPTAGESQVDSISTKPDGSSESQVDSLSESQVDSLSVPPLRTPLVGGEEERKRETPAPGANVVGFEVVTEAARGCFPESADAVAALALDIGRTLGGRFGCYAAALRAARQHIDAGKAINDLHAWCLKVALRYRETGVPAGPIRVVGSSPVRARRPGFMESVKKQSGG